ncbi:hypothetical protein EV363DRAFT_1259574 [Boletus edulis]|uniref:Rhodopsin domain-containing protein n=1 Tax=Boletus edulis BED1 TaxID=1328754 RepID=A0AAD4GHY9_BOLED|nr:hypothetical protein EV363DRAFT_1259574 [Boletus edulis]KAF8443658.1 hypothetical protein L210DRAFT_747455 [Boletus edulis BED1]
MTLHLTLNQQVAVSILYILAIITGTFRTFYRWYISRFWWEDVWATFALLLDIICFANVWIPQPRDVSAPDALLDGAVASHWMEAIALTSGLWAARMSMISAIIRITSHRVRFRHSAYATAVAFGIMWIALLIQKLYICAARSCLMNQHVATSQLVTDVISDVLLMALPLLFLRGVNIEHNQRVLLVSSFASSICITIISIVHSIFLFLPSCTATCIILAHVKTALALIICNLLVIVTFAYRLCRRNDLDLHTMPTKSDGAQFTSVFIGNGD